MKFTVNTDTLAELLGRIIRASSESHTLDIVRFLHVQVDAGVVIVTGTNTDVTARFWLEDPVVVTEGEGCACVQAKALLDAASRLDSPEVEIEFADREVVLRGGDARCVFTPADPALFPWRPPGLASDAPAVTIDGRQLHGAITAGASCMSSDRKTPQLMGANLLRRGDRLSIESTDVRRASQATVDLEGWTGDEVLLDAVLVPREAVRVLVDFVTKDELVTIGQVDDFLVLKQHNAELFITPNHLNFPDFDAVIPDTMPELGWSHMHFDRRELSAAVDFARLFSPQDAKLRLTGARGSDSLELYATNGQVGEVKRPVPMADALPDDVRVVLNIDNVSKALSLLRCDAVSLAYLDNKTPVVVTDPDDGDTITIVQPMEM